MEAGDRAAGDGDKQEREQVAGPYRAGTIDKLGQRRHRQGRAHNQDANRQPHDGADFQEGGEIIARGQQQPDRQYRSHKSVAHQIQSAVRRCNQTTAPVSGFPPPSRRR